TTLEQKYTFSSPVWYRSFCMVVRPGSLQEVIKRKLQVFINRCLRRILRIFWPNTITNTELWEKTETADINITIRKRKYGWIGYTLRKSPDEVCHSALHYNLQGSIPRGSHSSV